MKIFLLQLHRSWVEFVNRLTKQAASLGLDLYVAEHDVRAGHYPADKVMAEIRKSEALLVLLTRAGSDSKYVAHELERRREPTFLLSRSMSVERTSTAILQGIEYLPLDPGDPSADLDRDRVSAPTQE